MEEAGRLLCFLSSLQPSIFSCKVEGDWVFRSSARCVQSSIAHRPFSPSPLTAAIGPRDRPTDQTKSANLRNPDSKPVRLANKQSATDRLEGRKKRTVTPPPHTTIRPRLTLYHCHTTPIAVSACSTELLFFCSAFDLDGHLR